MSLINYIKKIWAEGEHFSHQDVNKIEQGIEDTVNVINDALVDDSGTTKAKHAQNSDRLGNVNASTYLRDDTFNPNNYPEFIGPRGPDGPRGADGRNGTDGATGPKGDKPNHGWSGTQLRFENPNGNWGSYVNLKGEKGDDGSPGASDTQYTELFSGEREVSESNPYNGPNVGGYDYIAVEYGRVLGGYFAWSKLETFRVGERGSYSGYNVWLSYIYNDGDPILIRIRVDISSSNQLIIGEVRTVNILSGSSESDGAATIFKIYGVDING